MPAHDVRRLRRPTHAIRIRTDAALAYFFIFSRYCSTFLRIGPSCSMTFLTSGAGIRERRDDAGARSTAGQRAGRDESAAVRDRARAPDRQFVFPRDGLAGAALPPSLETDSSAAW